MGVIYCIEHIDDGKKYIGSTIQKVEDRWYDHRYFLDKNAHANDHLQNAWNLYGTEAFKWRIVEDNIDDDALIDREIYWTKEYKTLNRKFGYNLREELGGGARRLSQETCKKLSEAHQGKRHNEATKQKISVALQGENHPMFGKRGEETSMFGRHHTEASNQKNSEAKIGEKNHNAILTEVQVLEIIELLKQGVSCADIAKMYGVSPSTIYAIKNKRKWKHLPR